MFGKWSKTKKYTRVSFIKGNKSYRMVGNETNTSWDSVHDSAAMNKMALYPPALYRPALYRPALCLDRYHLSINNKEPDKQPTT